MGPMNLSYCVVLFTVGSLSRLTVAQTTPTETDLCSLVAIPNSSKTSGCGLRHEWRADECQDRSFRARSRLRAQARLAPTFRIALFAMEDGVVNVWPELPEHKGHSIERGT